MRNDFEAVAETLLADIGDIKRELIRSGALGAMLTGSGSAVFGVFADEASARQAHGLLSTHRGWGVYVAKNLFD
jgi:4-diphosphocytidyl-2-C-methyl-D-erythritol kinase